MESQILPGTYHGIVPLSESEIDAMSGREELAYKRATGDHYSYLPYCPNMCERSLEDYERETNQLYGSVPRRIASDLALWLTLPAGMMAGPTHNLPLSAEGRFGLIIGVSMPCYEPDETLTLYAWQIGENTWISKPPRALLDCAFYTADGRTHEFVLRVLAMNTFRVSELAEISETVGMADGIRRLAALSKLVVNPELRPWLAELQEYARTLPGDPIDMWKGHTAWYQYERDLFVDEEFGVIWNGDRESCYDYVYGRH